MSLSESESSEFLPEREREFSDKKPKARWSKEPPVDRISKAGLSISLKSETLDFGDIENWIESLGWRGFHKETTFVRWRENF